MLKNSKGFTLIEIIGVVAVIAILSSMILPNIITRMNRALITSEEGNLDTIADGLIDYLLENRAIPASAIGVAGTPPAWADNISLMTGASSASLAETEYGCQRRFVVDPSGEAWLGFGTVGSLPYDQDTALSPVNGVAASATIPSAVPTGVTLRAMIISDISPGCTNVINGALATAAAFAAEWDQTVAATMVESNTLKIKRINYLPYFHPVTIIVHPGAAFARKAFGYDTVDGLLNTIMLYTAINSTIFQYTYTSGGFMPVAPATAVTATMSIGTTAGGVDVLATGTVITGGGSATGTGLTVASAATGSIYFPVALVITGAGTIAPTFVDVTIHYAGLPTYTIVNRTTASDALTLPTTTTPTSYPASGQIYLIEDTQLQLRDHLVGNNLIFSTTIRGSETFFYTPGPPAVWGR